MYELLRLNLVFDEMTDNFEIDFGESDEKEFEPTLDMMTNYFDGKGKQNSVYISRNLCQKFIRILLFRS